MAGTSIAEVVNRDAKASKIADYMRRAAVVSAIEVIRTEWKEGDWEHIADLAGTKPPSEITKVLVLQKLKDMAK